MQPRRVVTTGDAVGQRLEDDERLRLMRVDGREHQQVDGRENAARRSPCTAPSHWTPPRALQSIPEVPLELRVRWLHRSGDERRHGTSTGPRPVNDVQKCPEALVRAEVGDEADAEGRR